MARVNFEGRRISTKLYFKDLDVNESFCIDSSRSQGAVYRKVEKRTRSYEPNEYYMMEEATGMLFPDHGSAIKRVTVEVNVSTKKPACY